MKNKVLSLWLTALMMLVCHSLLAFESDGISYDITSSAKLTVEVTSGSNEYSGDVTIPESITYDGKNYRVTSIGDGAFGSCSRLTSVIIPSSVTSIGDGAFFNCTSLESVTIGNSVTSIGSYAFSGCYNLYNIAIPESVTSIGEYAFCDCYSLGGISIPGSVTNIGSVAFGACFGLTGVAISNGVVSIGHGAFSGCWLLEKITIPESVTSIGSSAFSDCSRLASITIPESVTSIGDYAFYGCSSLSSIRVEAGNTKYDSRNDCNAIIETKTKTLIAGCGSTTIPDGVTCIGKSAFQYYENYDYYIPSSLTSITIPESVTSIGDLAFYGCENLETVICYAQNVPTTQSNSFSPSYVKSATLIVPEASLQSYKSTAPWSEFGTFMTIEEIACATPVFSIENGVVTATSATEGSECFLTYTPLGFVDKSSFSVEVTAYAVADGYPQSLTVTKTIEFGVGKRGDYDGDGDVTVGDVVTLANYILGK